MSTPILTARNATLSDMVAVLREQRARVLDVVAPATAIHARGGNLIIDSTVQQLTAEGVTSAAGRATGPPRSLTRGSPTTSASASPICGDCARAAPTCETPTSTAGCTATPAAASPPTSGRSWSGCSCPTAAGRAWPDRDVGAQRLGRPGNRRGGLLDRPTAVFCANDMVALGFLQSMTQRGIRVPEDVAIIGYDDIQFAAAAAVPLSSVRQPREQLGRSAAQLLLEEALEADSHQHRQVIFQPSLEARRSSQTGPWAEASWPDPATETGA